MKKVCVPRFAVKAKYESSAGDRNASCRRARGSVSERRIGMSHWRSLYLQAGSLAASAHIGQNRHWQTRLGYLQWSRWRIPASHLDLSAFGGIWKATDSLLGCNPAVVAAGVFLFIRAFAPGEREASCRVFLDRSGIVTELKSWIGDRVLLSSCRCTI